MANAEINFIDNGDGTFIVNEGEWAWPGEDEGDVEVSPAILAKRQFYDIIKNIIMGQQEMESKNDV